MTATKENLLLKHSFATADFMEAFINNLEGTLAIEVESDSSISEMVSKFDLKRQEFLHGNEEQICYKHFQNHNYSYFGHDIRPFGGCCCCNSSNKYYVCALSNDLAGLEELIEFEKKYFPTTKTKITVTFTSCYCEG